MFRHCHNACHEAGCSGPRTVRRDRRAQRPGLTLLEMMLAIAILVMIAGALAGLSKAVQMTSDYGEGQGMTTQHARVALERIERTVSEAAANESFPGFLVVEEYVSSWRFPDTLVVWHPPAGVAAADPKGLPRFSELVIFCPNPQQPSQLLEITVPGDTRTAPAADNQAAWASEITAIKKSSTAQTVLVTDLLRTCYVADSTSSTSDLGRGAVRFESRLRPSADEWSQYRSGTLPWRQLSWVQGIYGSQTGLRQAWLRIEMQLAAGGTAAAAGLPQGIPFFGSAALYYEMHR